MTKRDYIASANLEDSEASIVLEIRGKSDLHVEEARNILLYIENAFT